MTCDECKKHPATVFFTQIVGGKLLKVNLCETCSKENGVTDPYGFSLADKLLGLGAAQEMERGANVQRCGVCGFSQADFKKTGRLGCAACYDTFSDGLQSLLKGMHKGSTHTGKVPTRLQESMEREHHLKELHGNLKKAVAEENYETAAEIRDRIKTLEVDG